MATRSVGKLRELRPLFEAHGLRVIDLAAAQVPEDAVEEALEAFSTFEANALAKARHFFARSGRPTVADDSGLVVDALGGWPGVRSKRWSGQSDLSGQPLDDENNRMLVRGLAGVQNRGAHYVCAAAYVDGRRQLVERGEVHGTILPIARGVGGFGYDPYFLSSELGQTFGEVGRDEKARVSHRARAIRALLAAIGREWLPGADVRARR